SPRGYCVRAGRAAASGRAGRRRGSSRTREASRAIVLIQPCIRIASPLTSARRAGPHLACPRPLRPAGRARRDAGRRAGAPVAKKRGAVTRRAKAPQRSMADQFSRVVAPPDLLDPERRRTWGLGRTARDRGPYIVELNLQHSGGLPGAAARFLQLHGEM